MLHHDKYRAFTMHYVGRLVNHDDTIPENDLKIHVTDTAVAWKQRQQLRLDAEAELTAIPPRPSTPPLVKVQEPEPVIANVPLSKTVKLKSKVKSIFTRKKRPIHVEPVQKKEEYVPSPSPS